MRKKKKKEKDNESKIDVEKTGNNKTDYNRQTKFLLIIMVALLLCVFVSHFVIQELNRIEYYDIEFYREKEGSVTFYKSVTGLATDDGKNIAFKLRNNPEELASIPLEGKVKLRYETVLSIAPELNNCTDTYKTIIDFSWTLSGLGIKTSAGTPNKEYAQEKGIPVIDCTYARGDRTVVLMIPGEETKITRMGECYVIRIKDCQVQESFERFVLGFIESAVKK